MKRTKRYTPEDWKKIQAEQSSIYQDSVALMKAGGNPSDPKAMESLNAIVSPSIAGSTLALRNARGARLAL